jgi:hypothetical protein
VDGACQPVQSVLGTLNLNGCSVLPSLDIPIAGVNNWPRSQATELFVCPKIP